MPDGRPFLRSASFCGNSGTMKASLVSAACEVVDTMKIARAKVAEIAKDLARPTVMHMVCSPLLLAALTPPEHSCAATNPCAPRAGGLTAGALPPSSTNAAVVYSRLGGANGRQLRHSHTDVIAPTRGGPALSEALSLGSVFVDRTIRSECVEYERKRDVVGHIDKPISLSLLYDDVADVAARGDRCLIESRRLSWLPLQQEIGALDGASAPQQSECPRFVASWHDLDGHHALHRLDAFGKRSIIEEGLLAVRVIADVGIASVIMRIGVARDEHLAPREAVAKAIERFQARRNEPQVPPGHGTRDRLTGELLPPAFGLPVVHHEIRVPQLPVVPKSRTRPSTARSNTSAALHSGQ